MRKFCLTAGLALSISALALPTAASAAVTCPFTISSLSIDYAGNVNAAFLNGGNIYGWYICNLSGTISVNIGTGATNFTSGECNALYAQLLTARAAGQTVSFSFFTPTSCTVSALPPSNNWMSPNFPANFSF